MLLKNLISNLPEEIKEITITGLSTNSKEIKRGHIFFAIKGTKNNGEKYVKEAISKGASVIVCSNNFNYKNKKVIVVKRKNIRNFVSEISYKFNQ